MFLLLSAFFEISFAPMRTAQIMNNGEKVVREAARGEIAINEDPCQSEKSLYRKQRSTLFCDDGPITIIMHA